MKVNKTVVILGEVESITWSTTDKRKATSFLSGTYALACNSARTCIYLLPFTNAVEVDHRNTRAGRTYRLWSEMEPSNAWEMNVPSKDLQRIGTIHRINYASDKWVGRLRHYTHEFDPTAILYADRIRSPRVWGAKRSRGKIVTKDGIE